MRSEPIGKKENLLLAFALPGTFGAFPFLSITARAMQISRASLRDIPLKKKSRVNLCKEFLEAEYAKQKWGK